MAPEGGLTSGSVIYSDLCPSRSVEAIFFCSGGRVGRNSEEQSHGDLMIPKAFASRNLFR